MSKEIKGDHKHLTLSNRIYIEQALDRGGCHWGRCTKFCNHYEPIICDDLKSPPYVCSGCKVRDTCRAAKYFYIAEEAQKRYKAILSESRAGINMTPEQLKELDEFISPLIKKGATSEPHILSLWRFPSL